MLQVLGSAIDYKGTLPQNEVLLLFYLLDCNSKVACHQAKYDVFNDVSFKLFSRVVY